MDSPFRLVSQAMIGYYYDPTVEIRYGPTFGSPGETCS